MADSENVPTSKKRAAGRELSRDDPGLEDEEISEQETGTFKRASDEVLAMRRMVKVQRKKNTSAPSANPFSGIRLVPRIEEKANEEKANVDEPVSDDIGGKKDFGEDCEKLKGEIDILSENTGDELEAKKTGVENVKSSNEDGETEAHKTDAKNLKSIKDGEPEAESTVDLNVKIVGECGEPGIMRGEAEAEKAVDKENLKNIGDRFDKKPVRPDKNEDEEEPKEGDNGGSEKSGEEASNLSSFQQLSSSQNAFTGLAGSGACSSAFSFGAIPNDGFLSGLSQVSKSISCPSMKEVAVETGEENEEAVFHSDSALYEFVEGVWKERGKGELRVNVSKSGGRIRLVMRARGNYRLILNAVVYADMKFSEIEKKGISFACVNCAPPQSKTTLSTFALKFRDSSVVEKFRGAVLPNVAEDPVALSG